MLVIGPVGKTVGAALTITSVMERASAQGSQARCLFVVESEPRVAEVGSLVNRVSVPGMSLMLDTVF